MSREKEVIMKELYQGEDKRIISLIRTFLWRGNPLFERWQDEVRNTVSHVVKTSNNAFPELKDLMEELFYSWSDCWSEPDWAANYISNAAEDKYRIPKRYDADNLLNYIKDYLYWVCECLSSRGFVDKEENKIMLNALLRKYPIANPKDDSEIAKMPAAKKGDAQSNEDQYALVFDLKNPRLGDLLSKLNDIEREALKAKFNRAMYIAENREIEANLDSLEPKRKSFYLKLIDDSNQGRRKRIAEYRKFVGLHESVAINEAIIDKYAVRSICTRHYWPEERMMCELLSIPYTGLEKFDED